MKLEELMASLGNSVQQAQWALEQMGVRQYMSYFDAAGEGTNASLRPKTVSFFLPGKEDQAVELPVLALCNHGRMSFDQVTIRLNVALDIPADGGGLEATPVAAGEGGHQIELAFRLGEPAEAISRFSDAVGQIL